MKRWPNLSLTTWFGFFALFFCSCNNSVQSIGNPRPHLLQPGSVYRITYNDPVDKYDIGTFFKDPANLSLSPLAPMYRKPVIIKADDLQARVSLGWRRDKTKLEVKKVGERQYHIDCSAAQYPHELETVEELLFMEEISSVKVLGE